MKKWTVTAMLLLLCGLMTACGNAADREDLPDYTPSPTAQPTTPLPLQPVMPSITQPATQVPETEDNGETEDDPVNTHPYEWSLHDLSQVIEAAGFFWEDWWWLTNAFDVTSIDWQGAPEHLFFMGVMPEGATFSSLDDIRAYLGQFYTPTWVDGLLYFPQTGGTPSFAEYDGVLLINGIRMSGMPRPDWTRATHVLVTSDETHAVVETTVVYSGLYWTFEGQANVVWNTIYRFTFENGKIDDVTTIQRQNDMEQIESAPHSAALVYESVNISPYGRAAVDAFLAQVLTLHRQAPIPITGQGMHGWWGVELQEGQFFMGWDEIDGNRHAIISDTVPDVYLRFDLDEMWQPGENHGFFDNRGNRITDAPWILGDTYATRYRLWDFDGSGIPVITLYYGGNWLDDTANSGMPGEIFIYENGAFRRFLGVRDVAGWPRLHTSSAGFYFCPNGNLMRSDVGFGGAMLVWFDRVDFYNGQTIYTPYANYFFGNSNDRWSHFASDTLNVPITWTVDLHAWRYHWLLMYQSLGLQLSLISPY